MFPRLRGQETFVAETFFASEKQKMFLTFFRNILFFQEMFPRLRGEETMFPQQCFRNNVSSFAGAFTTLRLLFVRKFLNHRRSSPPIPNRFNLRSKHSWGTLSNALAKSRKIASVALELFLDTAQSLKQLRS